MRFRHLFLGVFLLVLFALTGSATGYYLARQAAIHRQQAHLMDQVRTIAAGKHYAGQELRAALTAMAHSAYPHCSAQDLVFLRTIVYHSKVLQDAGWMQQGKIICSAMLDHKGLDAIHLTLRAHTLYGGSSYLAQDTAHPAIPPSLVLERGDGYAATSSFYPAQQSSSDVQISGTVADVRGFYVGLPDPSLSWIYTRPGLYQHANAIHATTCNAAGGSCQTATMRIDDVMRHEQQAIHFTTLCGGLLGLMLALLIGLFYARNQRMERQLYRAIKKDRLYLEYQPVVRISDGSITGAEVLCRWRNEEGEQISPERFIHIAEERHWIHELTERVVHHTLEDWADYLIAHPDFRLALNLSTLLLLDPAYPDHLEKRLAAYGIKPSSIILEVTESATANNLAIAEPIALFRARGYRVDIDDFGTGYSSLSRLHDLRVDAIKIDKAFTWAIGTDSVMVGILPQLLAIADALALEVVVEGIETEAQASYFRVLNRPLFGQGWLYGHSMMAAELKEKIAAQ